MTKPLTLLKSVLEKDWGWTPVNFTNRRALSMITTHCLHICCFQPLVALNGYRCQLQGVKLLPMSNVTMSSDGRKRCWREH
jgi:hypothetical protein